MKSKWGWFSLHCAVGTAYDSGVMLIIGELDCASTFVDTSYFVLVFLYWYFAILCLPVEVRDMSAYASCSEGDYEFKWEDSNVAKLLKHDSVNPVPVTGHADNRGHRLVDQSRSRNYDDQSSGVVNRFLRSSHDFKRRQSCLRPVLETSSSAENLSSLESCRLRGKGSSSGEDIAWLEKDVEEAEKTQCPNSGPRRLAQVIPPQVDMIHSSFCPLIHISSTPASRYGVNDQVQKLIEKRAKLQTQIHYIDAQINSLLGNQAQRQQE